MHELMRTVELSKYLSNVLIYDERKLFSLSKQDSSNGNIVWVPLCTDKQRQILFVDIFLDNRFFVVNILILFR